MASEEEDAEIVLNAGMPVKNPDGKDFGTLETVLVEEASEEAAFVLVRADEDQPRLVPWEVLAGVKDGALIMEADPENLEELPRVDPDGQPTEADIARAYQVFGFVEESAS